MQKRDEFPNKTKELLAKRVGYSCSNPDCRQSTSGPQELSTGVINVGVAAHITAASLGGPRYDVSLSPKQRSAPDNGIWLCQKCAKLVDSDTTRYTVYCLKMWKRLSEDDALKALEGGFSKRSENDSIPYPLKFKSEIEEGNTKVRVLYSFRNCSKEEILIEGYFIRVFFRDKITIQTSKDGKFHSYGRMIEPSGEWQVEPFDWGKPEVYGIGQEGIYAFSNNIIYSHEGQNKILTSTFLLNWKPDNP